MTDFLENDEPTYLDEDKRAKTFEDLDDDQLDSELESMEEEIEKKSEEPKKDTSSEDSEPEDSQDENKDTSDEPPEKPEADEESDKDEKPEEEKPSSQEEGTFTVNDEFISKLPDENKKLFENFKGKGKSDLAKAAANAIALKNPYLKGNEEAINAVAKKLEAYEDNDLVSTFIEAKQETGKPKDQPLNQEPQKVELPTLPEDDPKVKQILSKEVAKQLRKKYPDMPEDMESEDYKEWERDLMDEGLRKSEKFLTDLKSAEGSVKGEMQKVVYAQTNLKNLYNENPSEILPLLNKHDLGQLKHLNDNYKDVNNNALQQEVNLIEQELKKFNLGIKDLGLDLELKPDNTGVYYNETLSPLMMNGESIDDSVVARIGKVPLLKKGQLANKFIQKNNALILTKIASLQSKNDDIEKDRLKSENLNTLGGDKSGRKVKEISTEKIRNTYDDAELDQIEKALESKYD